ncbi:hypothetical protein ACFL3G_02350 [Planctomycetota bacterium]
MKNRKKRKGKKIYLCLAVVPAIGILLCLGLLYKPGYFTTPTPIEDEQVSEYLTHELAPNFYNGIQLGEPFDLVVSQEGINDIIARSKWPRQGKNFTFMTPKVFFVSERIAIMGAVVVKDAEFIVTIVGNPVFDEQGLLTLKIEQVKVGALNVTLLAKLIIREIYSNHIKVKEIKPGDIVANIVMSLLNNKPFEPVLEISDKKARIENVAIEPRKLTLHLSPIKD